MGKENIELITQFPRVMHMIRRKLMSGFDRTKQDQNYNPTQRLVLLLTSEDKQLSMTELHKFTGLEKGSLTTVIDQLIKKGMVARVGDEKDRRKVYVTLTPLGQKKVAALHEDVSRFIESQLEKLSTDQREAFYKAMKIFADISEQL